MKKQFSILLLSALLILLQACGGGETVIYTGDSEPADFMLTVDKPAEFVFDVAEDGSYILTLDVTYFTESVQNNQTLNLKYQLEGSSSSEQKFSIPLKTDKGWAGAPEKEGSMDYKLTHEISKKTEFKKGKTTFRLFADTDKDHPLMGMVKFTLVVKQ